MRRPARCFAAFALLSSLVCERADLYRFGFEVARNDDARQVTRADGRAARGANPL